MITNSLWPLPARHHLRRRLKGLDWRSLSRSRKALNRKFMALPAQHHLRRRLEGLDWRHVWSRRGMWTRLLPRFPSRDVRLSPLPTIPCFPEDTHLGRRGPAGPREFERKQVFLLRHGFQYSKQLSKLFFDGSSCIVLSLSFMTERRIKWRWLRLYACFQID